MKILKILLCLTSLILLSCKNNTDSQQGKTFDQDIDGDLLPNHLDHSPYIADIPSDQLQFKLEVSHINTLEKGYIAFSDNIESKQTIYTHLIQNKFSENLKLDINDIPFQISQSEIFKYKGSKFRPVIQDDQVLTNLEYFIKNSAGKVLFTHSSSPDQYIEEDLVPKKHLSLMIQNYDFNRAGKTMTYQSLLKSIKKKTYKITILKTNSIKTFYVSKKLSLGEAISKVGVKRNQESNWHLMTPLSQKSNNHVFLIYLDEKSYKKYSSLSAAEKENMFVEKFELDISRFIRFSLNLKGSINIEEPRVQIERYKYSKRVGGSGSLGGSRYTTATCHVNEHSFIATTYKINNKNIQRFFTFYLDDKKVDELTIKNGSIYFDDLNKAETLRVEYIDIPKKKKVIGLSRAFPACPRSFFLGEVNYQHGLKAYNPNNFIDINLEIQATPSLESLRN